MEELEEQYIRLKQFLIDSGLPEWKDVLFAENIFIDASSKKQIEKQYLLNQNQFSRNFNSLINKGYSWVNLSGLGLIDDTLIVSVEKPNKHFPGAKTSVNLSGPSRCVVQNGYSLDKYLEISA